MNEYVGQGLYSGLPACPKCHSADDVNFVPIRFVGAMSTYNTAKIKTWCCNKCPRETNWDSIFRTPPQSHFICCSTIVLVCPRCNGRGWFRR